MTSGVDSSRKRTVKLATSKVTETKKNPVKTRYYGSVYHADWELLGSRDTAKETQ